MIIPQLFNLEKKHLKLSLVQGSKHYSLYRVQLPKRVKGIPIRWNVLVISGELDIFDTKTAVNLFIKKLSQDSFPLIIASQSENFILESEIDINENFLILVEANQLEEFPTISNDIQDSLFVNYIKDKIEETVKITKLNPYTILSPVNGWKFFGREKQIQTIINTESNFLIHGARKIGKTSILKELRQRLVKSGSVVFYIDVQQKDTIEKVTDSILKELDPKELVRAKKVSNYLGSYVLETVLKRLITKNSGKTVYLLIDELGNSLQSNKKGDWEIIGILRSLSHQSTLRVIATGFQEILDKQSDYSHPLVNFGRNLKLKAFDENDVSALIISPLKLWGKITEEKEVLKIVQRNFGTHPLVLQYLGNFLWSIITTNELITDDVLEIIESTIAFSTNHLKRKFKNHFEECVDEIFFKIDQPLLKYVYAKFCYENATNNQITDEIALSWISNLLEGLGLSFTYKQKMNLFLQLELRGLIMENDLKAKRYIISCPIVYFYLLQFDDYVEFLSELKNDIINE